MLKGVLRTEKDLREVALRRQKDLRKGKDMLVGRGLKRLVEIRTLLGEERTCEELCWQGQETPSGKLEIVL